METENDVTERPEYVETLVIGGGQAGLAVGYHLTKAGRPFLIVDANERVGDAWRNRWDSLHLFTPNVFNGLPGMRNPGGRWDLPSKDEFADYLERYAKEFGMPVQTGVRVNKLARNGPRFVATADDRSFESDNVVVAMSSWQDPKVPAFASDLDPGIVQLHVADYRNPRQLRDGDVLVVGVGNSGAEIAMELSRTNRVVWLSGRPFGVLPFRPTSASARVLMPFVGRIIFHRVLTTDTPMGRRARPKMLAGDPLIRVKPKDLAAAGVERVPRTAGVVDGLPRLEDGRVLDVANVVWCTGFHTDFSWIDLPVLGPHEPKQNRGIVEEEPGLYFVGLKFLYSKSSEQIHGVGRDAARIADAIATRQRKASRR